MISAEELTEDIYKIVHLSPDFITLEKKKSKPNQTFFYSCYFLN